VAQSANQTITLRHASAAAGASKRAPAWLKNAWSASVNKHRRSVALEAAALGDGAAARSRQTMPPPKQNPIAASGLSLVRRLSSRHGLPRDIKKQVDELKALTVSTVTIDGVKQHLDAIKNDLKAISGAQKDLSSDRRAEVEAATKAFASSVESIAAEAVTSLSLGDAKAALVDALQNLGQSFEDSFAPLNCD
jgi:hypothetical protein